MSSTLGRRARAPGSWHDQGIPRETNHGRDLVLRAIIAFKAVKAVILYALAGAALVLRKELFVDLERLVNRLGITAGRPTIRRLLHIEPHQILLIAIGSVLYASVFLVEAWGLHRRKRWAEWMTVGVTASLIPFEIYELVEETTITKVIALIVNIGIVIYLVVRRLRDRHHRR